MNKSKPNAPTLEYFEDCQGIRIRNLQSNRTGNTLQDVYCKILKDDQIYTYKSKISDYSLEILRSEIRRETRNPEWTLPVKIKDGRIDSFRLKVFAKSNSTSRDLVMLDTKICLWDFVFTPKREIMKLFLPSNTVILATRNGSYLNINLFETLPSARVDPCRQVSRCPPELVQKLENRYKELNETRLKTEQESKRVKGLVDAFVKKIKPIINNSKCCIQNELKNQNIEKTKLEILERKSQLDAIHREIISKEEEIKNLKADIEKEREFLSSLNKKIDEKRTDILPENERAERAALSCLYLLALVYRIDVPKFTSGLVIINGLDLPANLNLCTLDMKQRKVIYAAMGYALHFIKMCLEFIDCPEPCNLNYMGSRSSIKEDFYNGKEYKLFDAQNDLASFEGGLRILSLCLEKIASRINVKEPLDRRFIENFALVLRNIQMES